MRKFIGFILCIAFLNTPAHSFELFRIVSDNCPNSQRPIIQTGFSFSNGEAIITALHGVAACEKIRGEHFQDGSHVGNALNLQVGLVDTARDVAVLSNSERNRISVVRSEPPSSDERLFISGFPRGISLPDRLTVAAGSPPLRSLRSILGSDMLEEFFKVGSPSPAISIIRIDGNAQKGHSGAPIVDTSGAVVGIMIGGFDSGEFGVSWGVPISDVELSQPGDDIYDIVERRHQFGMVRGGELPSFLGELSAERYTDANRRFAQFAEANQGRMVCLNITLDRSSSGGEAAEDCDPILGMTGYDMDTSIPLPFAEDFGNACYYHASFSVDGPVSSSSGGTGLWFESFNGYFRLSLSNVSHIWWIEADEQQFSGDVWADHPC